MELPEQHQTAAPHEDSRCQVPSHSLLRVLSDTARDRMFKEAEEVLQKLDAVEAYKENSKAVPASWGATSL